MITAVAAVIPTIPERIKWLRAEANLGFSRHWGWINRIQIASEYSMCADREDWFARELTRWEATDVLWFGDRGWHPNGLPSATRIAPQGHLLDLRLYATLASDWHAREICDRALRPMERGWAPTFSEILAARQCALAWNARAGRLRASGVSPLEETPPP